LFSRDVIKQLEKYKFLWKKRKWGSITKTVIVDLPGGSAAYHTIKDGVNAFTNGGVVVVEEGTYDIGTSDIVSVPSNVTIIGRGNAIIEVTARVSAFVNADQSNGNDSITISGFKYSPH